MSSRLLQALLYAGTRRNRRLPFHNGGNVAAVMASTLFDECVVFLPTRTFLTPRQPTLGTNHRRRVVTNNSSSSSIHECHYLRCNDMSLDGNHYRHGDCRYFSSAAAVSASSRQEEGSIIPFALADIGEGIKEVELLQWFVQPGDRVHQFDRICEVQSDKATVEITSRYDGIVHELTGGNVGDMVQVGTPLLLIRLSHGTSGNENTSNSSDNSTNGSMTPTTTATTSTTTSLGNSQTVLHSQHSDDLQLHIPHVASQFHLESDHEDDPHPLEKSASSSGSKKYLATPAVRKLGMEYNLDLATLVGTGPQGRVLKSDVLTFLRESGKMPFASPPTDAPASSDMLVPNDSVTSSSTAAAEAAAMSTKDEMITLKGYHRLMIQSMIKSQEIPHMGFTDEFNLTKLMHHRTNLSSSSSSPKLSILAFFIKATSLAMREYPIINASWKDMAKGEVTAWASHNIGVAMDTPRGLVVPVIRNCQIKSLVEIQQDLDELKQIAAAGKLGEQHVTGATFSISNIGSLGGGTYMNPLIVPPQAAIGALGALQTLPRFGKDGITVEAAKIMNISWAADHRMIDGATIARFSNRCKGLLEDPMQMLLAMK